MYVNRILFCMAQPLSAISFCYFWVAVLSFFSQLFPFNDSTRLYQEHNKDCCRCCCCPFRVDGWKRLECATCGRVCFQKRFGKHPPYFKISEKVWRRKNNRTERKTPSLALEICEFLPKSYLDQLKAWNQSEVCFWRGPKTFIQCRQGRIQQPVVIKIFCIVTVDLQFSSYELIKITLTIQKQNFNISPSY